LPIPFPKTLPVKYLNANSGTSFGRVWKGRFRKRDKETGGFISMAVTIALISNFSLGVSESENFLLPPNVNTIGDLLRHVGEKMNFPFIAADADDLRRDIEVSINGKDVWFYPDALNTPLKDGDSVEVNLVPLGGG
jgi:hypothetical protein